MDDQNKPEAIPEASAMAIPLLCPRDGDVLYEGTKTIAGTTFNAWLCPTCTYWKIRTVASS